MQFFSLLDPLNRDETLQGLPQKRTGTALRSGNNVVSKRRRFEVVSMVRIATRSAAQIFTATSHRLCCWVNSAGMPACLVSGVLHACVLVALAMIVLTGPTKGLSPRIITLLPMSEDQPLTDSIVELHFGEEGSMTATPVDSVYSQMAPMGGPETVAVSIASADVAGAISVASVPALRDRNEPTARQWKDLMQEIEQSQGSHPPRIAAEGVSVASDAGSAASGILGELANDLEEGPIYLIWLLDASISLVNDRQYLAKTLEPFYEQYKTAKQEKSRLMSAVVAYGKQTTQIQDTTNYGGRNLKAIRNMSIDPSGVENVMTAVQQVIARYAVRSKNRLRIVVWTDESGDDCQLLESTVAMCRKTNTVVHVVGPSSVLGTDRGLQSYTDRGTGWKFFLPVRRGPDSCLPERLLLPYWFDSSATAGRYKGFMVNEGLSQYGGAIKERLMAGIGPYSLTRLALQTGGRFTILDRPDERQQWDLAAMKEYFPSYESVEEIVAGVNQSALRKAICGAVQATYKPINLAPPQMSFFMGERSRDYPFRYTSSYYIPPTEFRSMLAAEIIQQVAQVTASSRCIEEALSHFRPETDWEYEYGMETSARWRAWYDLTRGRLLTMSIRHQEYLATCKWLVSPGNLGHATNLVNLEPGPQVLTTDPEIKDRLKTAERLLRRCSKGNAGTPWELLAQWELEHSLGLRPVQVVIPPPPPPPPEPVVLSQPVASPQISLPNL
jgi:hypothetical protein